MTAILDLAIHSQENIVVLADISKRQNISLSYLEQLFAKLKKAGLITSVRGPGGGYRLNHPFEKISIAQIIDAVNESLDITKCRGAKNCQNGDKCLTHHLWNELSNLIHRFLSSISIANLMQRTDSLNFYAKKSTTHNATKTKNITEVEKEIEYLVQSSICTDQISVT